MSASVFQEQSYRSLRKTKIGGCHYAGTSRLYDGSLSIKLRFWSLTAKSYESELQQQKPLSSIVFRLYRIAQTPMLNGRPSKMLWRASAFLRGTILGFLIGKRSKNHAAMW